MPRLRALKRLPPRCTYPFPCFLKSSVRKRAQKTVFRFYVMSFCPLSRGRSRSSFFAFCSRWKNTEINEKGAVASRLTRIKNRGIVKRSQYPFETNHKFEEIKVENLRFSSFFIVFYSFSPLSPNVCIYAFGARTKNSALNPFAPRFCSH